jgi:CHAT domain-containing protein
VHFACHAASDAAAPSRSLLLLHDHDSAPLTVARLAPVDFRQAKLAYLSACRTPFTGRAELADEAIHLTSAFALAGFSQVVGTLWEIDDAAALEITEGFYTSLRSGGTLNVSDAARALHRATRALRDKYPAAPALWSGHVHAGA